METRHVQNLTVVRPTVDAGLPPVGNVVECPACFALTMTDRQAEHAERAHGNTDGGDS